MSHRSWQQELREWLQRHWGEQSDDSRLPEIPEELRRKASQSLAGATRLAAVKHVMTGTSLRKSPPSDLAGRVMQRVDQVGVRQPVWRRLWVAVPLAASMAVALTLSVVFAMRGGEHQPDMVVVRFSLEAPAAAQVAVVGDWNDWQSGADPMLDLDRDGVWEIEMRLRRDGEYRYQFLIDGEQWIPDPHAPLQVEDGFGGTDSILQI